jgi:hypothetical protein
MRAKLREDHPMVGLLLEQHSLYQVEKLYRRQQRVSVPASSPELLNIDEVRSDRLSESSSVERVDSWDRSDRFLLAGGQAFAFLPSAFLCLLAT